MQANISYMELRVTTQQILKVLEVLSWIIFTGLCIDAGAIVVNTVITLFINPNAVEYFWTEPAYLSNLYDLDKGHFVAVTLVMTIVAVLKAIMFYLILCLMVERKLDLTQPFKQEIRRFISLLAYFATAIGLFSYYGYRYCLWLTKMGIEMGDLQALHVSGADVWLFMAVILFLIGQIVKRGIEIQAENELTI